MSDSKNVFAARAAFSALLLGSSSVALAQAAPIVQPGAPGADSRTLTAEQASDLAAASYTPADVAVIPGLQPRLQHGHREDLAHAARARQEPQCSYP